MKNLKNQSLSLKRKGNEMLLRIANFLLLDASFIDNLGLLNGKMGIAIFFYHYARFTRREIFEDFAGELIEEIYEEISADTPVDFANGLTGIGWGIEYLVKQGFLEADTDDVLGEIDNAIYMSSLNRPILLDNGNDLFGYGFYCLSRLLGHEDDYENLNTLIKKQQLIYLTDECERVLIHKRYLEFNIPSLSIRTLNSVLWFLLEMQKLGLFPSKVEKLLRSLPGYLTLSLHGKENLVDRYLLCNLAQIIIKSNFDAKLQAQFLSIVNIIQTEAVTDKDDIFYINCLSELNLQRLIYQSDFNIGDLESELFIEAFELIDNEKSWNHRLDKLNKDNLGLTGLAGIGWSLLQNIEGSLTTLM